MEEEEEAQSLPVRQSFPARCCMAGHGAAAGCGLLGSGEPEAGWDLVGAARGGEFWVGCVLLRAEPVPVASRGAGCAAELFLRQPAAQEAAAGSAAAPGREHGGAALPLTSCPPAFPPAEKAEIFFFNYYYLFFIFA